MASDPPPVPQNPQTRQIIIAIAAAALALLSCGACGVGTMLYSGFGGGGSGQASALPPIVKKGAKLEFGHPIPVGDQFAVEEVRGSWVFVKHLGNNKMSWINFNNVSQVKTIE